MKEFLDRTSDRQIAPSYDGPIVLWDIDKTYLDTRFSSLRGLLAIPFEFAVDKRAIVGTVPLLRALRRGAGTASAVVPLYFVSGSPPQLRRVIEQKMTLDGVDFDGITFKDQWGLLRAGRPRDLRAQTAYKLLALLHYLVEVPSVCPWLLFGDDVEEDAQVFMLFKEVQEGLRGRPLHRTLVAHGVKTKDADELIAFTERLPSKSGGVERIFIHLANDTPPSAFADPTIVPTRSFLQTALVLAQMGRIRAEDVATVATELRRSHVPEAEIQKHLEDAQVRLGVKGALVHEATRPPIS